MYIMSGVNIALAILLLLFSTIQKGTTVHAVADYFCFIIFILIAILMALSATKENLVLLLLGATVITLNLTLN